MRKGRTIGLAFRCRKRAASGDLNKPTILREALSYNHVAVKPYVDTVGTPDHLQLLDVSSCAIPDRATGRNSYSGHGCANLSAVLWMCGTSLQ
jgi:hypothetical protein